MVRADPKPGVKVAWRLLQFKLTHYPRRCWLGGRGAYMIKRS